MPDAAFPWGLGWLAAKKRDKITPFAKPRLTEVSSSPRWKAGTFYCNVGFVFGGGACKILCWGGGEGAL